MKRLRLWSPLFLLITLLAGCYTSLPEPAERLRTTRATPAYAQAAAHYRAFASPHELAAYLRADSEAGLLLSAHRGGPASGFPENALPTFERALRFAPALIEADVRMSRDGVLVLMHDETLQRTTTGRGAVANQALTELRQLLLVDPRGVITPFRIPTLQEALAWSAGRAILTLDIRTDVPPERVVDAVRRAGAESHIVIIVYTLEDLLRYHRLAPNLMLSASATSIEDTEAILESGVDSSRLIAFTGVGEVKSEVIDLLHAHNIRAMLGTFGTVDERAQRAGPDVYRALIDRGIDVLTTNNVALAARATQAYEARPHEAE